MYLSSRAVVLLNQSRRYRVCVAGPLASVLLPAVNECLGKYTNPQSFEDYKRSREEELMGKSPQERQAAMSD